MRGVQVVVVLCMVCALPARADNTADEADIAFRLGNEAYAKRDYEKALAAYFLSNRLVSNKNVLYNIARCFEALKSFDEAYRYYYDLSIAKDLDAEDAKDVAKALERLAPKVALLAVTTDPPGADVYLDREDLGSRGRAPAVLATMPGSHKVKVRLEGMHDAEASVRVAKGGEKKVSLKLTPVVGTVELTGSPEGAVVRETEGGPELGRLPVKLTFPPGQRLFIVSQKGFNSTQVLVTIKPDDAQTVKATLTPLPPPTGKVVVTANRDNALIRVDGRESGFTPTVIVLPLGEHEIEVSMKDLKTVSQTVDVKAESDQKLHFELHYLAPKVGAASKNLVDADDAPASITVITREEIQSMGYQTLGEALQGVRGIQVHDDRIYNYLGIRGFSPPGDLNTRVLILWDGHSMNDIWAGQGFAERGLAIDLSEVERIEVVRGPGSALYGTGAFFAVINVVPRDVVGNDRNVEISTGVGGLNGGKAHVTGSVGGNGTSALASAAGFISSGDPITNLGATGVSYGNDAERVVSADARLKAGGVTVQAKFNLRPKQIPVPIYDTVVGAPGTSYTDSRGFAEIRWEHDWERLSLAVRGYYDKTYFAGTYMYLPDVEGDPLVQQHDFGGADWGGVELRARLKLFQGNTLVIGVEGQYQRIQQATSAVGTLDIQTYGRTLLSAYLLDEWRITKWLSLTVGVRIDKYLDLTALPITPRLGLVGRFYEGGTTKLVAGSAFRAPNIYETYGNDGYVSQRPVDGQLTPETIYTIELEHSHDFNEELRFTLGAYFNAIDKLVVLQTDAPPLEPRCGNPPGTAYCLVSGNSPNRIFATGAEAELRWQPNRFLFVDLTYSFVRLFDATADIYFNTSQHLVAAKATVPLAENYVRLSAQATYASPRAGTNSGDAFLINVGFSGSLSRFRYFAGVRNLLDARTALPVPTQSDFTLVPIYGRTFWLELTLAF